MNIRIYVCVAFSILCTCSIIADVSSDLSGYIAESQTLEIIGKSLSEIQSLSTDISNLLDSQGDNTTHEYKATSHLLNLITQYASFATVLQNSAADLSESFNAATQASNKTTITNISTAADTFIVNVNAHDYTNTSYEGSLLAVRVYLSSQISEFKEKTLTPLPAVINNYISLINEFTSYPNLSTVTQSQWQDLANNALSVATGFGEQWLEFGQLVTPANNVVTFSSGGQNFSDFIYSCRIQSLDINTLSRTTKALLIAQDLTLKNSENFLFELMNARGELPPLITVGGSNYVSHFASIAGGINNTAISNTYSRAIENLEKLFRIYENAFMTVELIDLKIQITPYNVKEFSDVSIIKTEITSKATFFAQAYADFPSAAEIAAILDEAASDNENEFLHERISSFYTSKGTETSVVKRLLDDASSAITAHLEAVSFPYLETDGLTAQNIEEIEAINSKAGIAYPLYALNLLDIQTTLQIDEAFTSLYNFISSSYIYLSLVTAFSAYDKAVAELKIQQQDSLYKSSLIDRNKALATIPTKISALETAEQTFLSNFTSDFIGTNQAVNLDTPASMIAAKKTLYTAKLKDILDDINKSKYYLRGIGDSNLGDAIAKVLDNEITGVAATQALYDWVGNLAADETLDANAQNTADDQLAAFQLAINDAYTFDSAIDEINQDVLYALNTISFNWGGDTTSTRSSIQSYAKIIAEGNLSSDGGEQYLNSQFISIAQSLHKQLEELYAPQHEGSTTNSSTKTPLTSGNFIAGHAFLNGTATATIGSQIKSASSHLFVSGDGENTAHLREIENSNTTAKEIHLNNSGRIGLGTQFLSENPGNTNTILQATSNSLKGAITIVADGNGVIELNSDLYIDGSGSDDNTVQPFIPTTNFGKDKEHRITITSSVERSIIITRNTILDLTAFSGNTKTYGQQIVFDGKTKLILEPGAKIRFPHISYDKKDYSPVLYFNGDSELIIRGTSNQDEERWEDYTGSNAVRCKMLGVGNIWFNKNAKMRINDSALFGIESDVISPKTDITFSLKRNSAILIGDKSSTGGAFQIGNQTDHLGESVSVGIIINGPHACFEINDNGFFGIAVGIINKINNPNGTAINSYNNPTEDPENQLFAWRVQHLANVSGFYLDIEQGKFKHSNIFTGSDADELGSLMAIGDLTSAGNYVLKLDNPRRSIIHGGGNVIYLSKNNYNHEMYYPVSLWNTATPVNIYDTGNHENDGICSLLAPDITLRFRQQQVTDLEGDSVTYYGRGIIKITDKKYLFAGPEKEFFKLITLGDDPASEPFIPIGKDQESVRIGYVNGTKIVRTTISAVSRNDGSITDPEEALLSGFVVGARNNTNNDPVSFMIQRR